MKWFVPIVVDALLVVLFCAIGRRSHDEAVLTGLLQTAWPFAAGLALGWLALFLVRRARHETEPFDGAALRIGFVLWPSTLVVGMLLRTVSGQGTAFSFMVVAATVLALFLLGWRVVARFLPLNRGERHSSSVV